MKKIEKEQKFLISYDNILESWVLWEQDKSLKTTLGLLEEKEVRVLVEQSKKNFKRSKKEGKQNVICK